MGLAGACPGWLPADLAAVVPGGRGGRMNPSGTCSSCPGGEDHLKRRSSSPPVPPLLGWRHCPKKGGSVCFAPKHKLPSALGACLAGTISAARVQSRGCKGRSPLHEKNLGLPLPAGKGGRGDRGRKTAKVKNRPAVKTIVPPRRAPQRQSNPASKTAVPPAGRLVRPHFPVPRGFSRGDARGAAPCIK